jgi:acyl-CoA thioesterase FadM
LSNINVLARIPQPAAPGRTLIDDQDTAYRFVVEVPTEPRQFAGGHLDNAGGAELLSAARNRYFAEAVAWPGIGPDTVWIPVRHVAIDYESEAFAGERLLCGVRACGRTRRTITLGQTMWEACSRRVVLRCTAVVVVFDTAVRRSIAVPDELWAAVQQAEYSAPPLGKG